MAGLNWLDIIALLLLSLSALSGLMKGLVRELISLGSVIAGFVLASFLYPQASLILISLGLSEIVAGLLGFLTIFLVSIIGGALLIRIIQSALKVLHLRWADRMAGSLFGLARGWLINAIIFLSLAAFPISSRTLAESRTAEFFLTSASLLLSFSSSGLKQRFEKGYQTVYEIWLKETLEDGGSN